MIWTYSESDPALMLFTAAMDRFEMSIAPGSHVLELGCAETNWLERMRMCDPTLDLTGVDAREQDRDRHANFRVLQDNACDPGILAPAAFDWVVMLGALEHFGLGFYGDPVVEDGDTRTMQNVVRWLRPGGHVYFDVPCNTFYRVQENRHFRQYAPASVGQRLIVPGLRERARVYSLPEPDAGTWCPEPTRERVPYHFVAVLAQKVDGD